MKKIFYLLIIWIWWILPPKVHAQTNFNGVGDWIYIERDNDTLVFVCTFDSTKNKYLSPVNARSSGDSIRVNWYSNSHVNPIMKNTSEVWFFGTGSGASFKGGKELNFSNDKRRRFGRYGGHNVSGLEAGNTSLSSINISWNRSYNADGYLVFRDNGTPLKPYHHLIGGSVTSMQDDDIVDGTEYTYYVFAYAIGKSDPSTRYLSAPQSITTRNQSLTFTASSSNESAVDFQYTFDSHTLFQLPSQRASLEITDVASGQVVFGPEELSFSDVERNNLTFQDLRQAVGFQSPSNIDGVNLSVPTLGSHSNWSFEAWIKPEAPGVGKHMMLMDQPGGAGIRIYNDGKIGITTAGQGQFKVASKDVLTFGQWVHIGLTHDGSHVKLFIDGTEVLIDANNDGNFLTKQAATSLTLNQNVGIGYKSSGTYSSTNFRGFKGLIGMVRFWNKVQNANQMADDYDEKFTQSVSHLIGQWTFEGSSPAGYIVGDDLGSSKSATLSVVGTSTSIQWGQSSLPSATYVTRDSPYRYYLPSIQSADNNKSYRLRLYEVGSGKILTTNTQQASFVNPGTPTLFNVVEEGDMTPYRIKITLQPSSQYADKYYVYRKNINRGDTTLVTVLSVNPDHLETSAATSVANSLIDYDSYVSGNKDAVMAGEKYEYYHVPYYSRLGYFDTTNTSVAINTAQSNNDTTTSRSLGLQLSKYRKPVNGVNQTKGVKLTWWGLGAYFSNASRVIIKRNEKTLAVVNPKDAMFIDTLMLFGPTYNYQIIAVKNDTLRFAQQKKITLSADGELNADLVTLAGNYLIKNKSLWLQKKTSNTQWQVIDTCQSSALGKISITGIEYGEKSTFRLVSTTGRKVFDNEFQLTRAQPSAVALVKYDTVYHVQRSARLLTSVKEISVINQMGFVLTDSSSLSGKTIFTNFYADDEFQSIPYPGATVSPDTLYYGLGSSNQTYNFRFMRYYFSSADDTVYVNDSSNYNFTQPTASVTQAGISLKNNHHISEDNSGTMEVKFGYAQPSNLSRFILKRKRSNKEWLITSFVPGASTGTLASNPKFYDYVVIDSMGYPGNTYKYVLYGQQKNGEIVPLDSSSSKIFPIIQSKSGGPNWANSFTVSPVSGGGVKANISFRNNRVGLKFWDGVLFNHNRGTNVPLVPLQKRVNGGTDNQLVVYYPSITNNATGTMVIRYYKHTDEGLYFPTSNILWKNWSGASIVKTAPPTLSSVLTGISINTGSTSGIEPVTDFNASTDARGRIFVSWKYPDFANVKFKVFYKKTGTGSWSSRVYDTSKRGFVDNVPAGDTVVYKIEAQYEEAGSTLLSNQRKAVGVSRQYLRFEGDVYDQNADPLPNVFVGIDENWTLSDSAGHYTLKDLEMVPGSYNLQYVIPGTAAKTNIPLTITSPVQVYKKDIYIDYGSGKNYDQNAILLSSSGLADVFDLVGQSMNDSGTFVNVIRWLPTNDNYSGFQVKRSGNIVATVKHGDKFRYVDTLRNNNEALTTYSVTSYYENASGEIVYGEEKFVNVSFPSLLSPHYAIGQVDSTNGSVNLNWVSTKRNVDGYVIQRNLQDLVDLKTTQFEDTTGIPGNIYSYRIYSYIIRGGVKIRSQLATKVNDMVFPYPPGPITASAIPQKTAGDLNDNVMKVKWDYPSASITLEGAAVYRDGDSLGYLVYPDTVLLDSTATPQTHVTYDIYTYNEVDGQLFRSRPKSVDIGFPKILPPHSLAVDTSTYMDSASVTWRYTARGIDSLVLIITNSGNTIVRKSYPTHDTSLLYQYYFVDGLAGKNYKYSVKAISYRSDKVYYSNEIVTTKKYRQLPKPVMSPVAYQALSSKATISWTYLQSSRHDGFKLTIMKLSGSTYSVYTGQDPMDTTKTITYLNRPFLKDDRSFEFIPTFEDLYNPGKTFKFIVTAYQTGSTTESSSSKVQAMNVGSQNNFANNVQATRSNLNDVTLSWSNPVTTTGLTGFVVKRDDRQIDFVKYQASGSYFFKDLNAMPGIIHTYEVAAKINSNLFAIALYGQRLGDGTVDAYIYGATSGNPIIGDSLIIQYGYGVHTFLDTVYSGQDGLAQFTQLPYNTEGIEFKVRVCGDPTDYVISHKKTTLKFGANYKGLGSFLNKKVRSITGRVVNDHCTGGCPRDSVETRLYRIPGSSGTAQLSEIKFTDDQGQITYTIPYHIALNDQYYVWVDKSSNGLDPSADELGFNFLEGDGTTVQNDSTIHVNYSTSTLSSKVNHHFVVRDQIYLPVNVRVTGPSSTSNPFQGAYEFQVRISEASGKVDTLIWTKGDSINIDLPPFEFALEVVDVDKYDAFSLSVLDYFKSRRLTLDNIGAYKLHFGYTGSGLQTKADSVEAHYSVFDYNERTQISFGWPDNIQQVACSNAFVLEADNNYDNIPSSAEVNIAPTQLINGVRITPETGYIIPVFSGGSVSSDTLRWNKTKADWDSVIITAVTPNLTPPYKQLFEAYYYDNNHNYLGSTSKEIIVLGTKPVDGQDVFVIPQDSIKVPLFVLRDPPGDNSFSEIKEGSSIILNLHRHFDRTKGQGFAQDAGFKQLKAMNLKSNNLIDLPHEQNKNSDQIELVFKESISTWKKSKLSSNLEGYLDGPDADIVVGLSVNYAYGYTQVLEWESCQIDVRRKMQVDPNQIVSTWYYTRSQLKNTIRYYNSLVEKSASTSGSTSNRSGQYYRLKDGVDLSFTTSAASSADPNREPGNLIDSIGYSLESYEKLLNTMDRKFTPACEMCDYFDSGEINTFCDQYVRDKKGGGCLPMSELINAWTPSEKEQYNTHYKKYIATKRSEELWSAIQASAYYDQDALNDFRNRVKSQLTEEVQFEPLENITFGAGAKVSREIEEKVSDKSEWHAGHVWDLKLDWNVGTNPKLDFGGWNGAVAGIYGKIYETEVKALFGFHHQHKSKSTDGGGDNNKTGLKYHFVLDDDDDGDHFNVDVYHSWTKGATNTGPYFNLIGGRSSCPSEKGTISRDLPEVSFIDENDQLLPSRFYDLDPNESFLIPVRVSSGNLFAEDRLQKLEAPLGSNKKGLNMTMETVKLNSYKGNTFWVDSDPGYYQSFIRVDRGKLPYYDYTDLQIIAKPSCDQMKGNYFEEQNVFDTLAFEIYFRKPTSPVTISTNLGNQWFINGEKKQLAIRLDNYKVDSVDTYSLGKIYLEYKRVNDQGSTWTRMVEHGTGNIELIRDSLYQEYIKNLNTYNNPVHNFVWNIDRSIGIAPDLLDGSYQIRAVAEHEKGGYSKYSNVMTGIIDRRKPGLVRMAPSDSLLSMNDGISVTFDEAIDTEFFRKNGSVEVSLYDRGKSFVRKLTFDSSKPVKFSDYQAIPNSSSILINVDPDTLKKYDGYFIKVHIPTKVSGNVTDLVGNGYDQDITWMFQIDWMKKTPSPLTIIEPRNFTYNLSNLSNDIFYTIGDYDLFESSFSLDSIRFEVRRTDQDNWVLKKVVKRKALLDSYEAYAGDSVPAIRDTINFLHFKSNSVTDGRYEVRIGVHSNGIVRYSNVVNVLKDTQSPSMYLPQEPADSIYSDGDRIFVEFTEPINDDDFKKSWITISDVTNPSTTIPYNYLLSGSAIQVLIDKHELLAVNGDVLKINISNIRDRAGNPLTGVKSWDFVVDMLKTIPSPVELLSPQYHVISLSNRSQVVNFVASGYDVFESSFKLDSLGIRYRHESENAWTWRSDLTENSNKLRADYKGSGQSITPSQPLDTFQVAFTGFEQGVYEVQAVAYGGGIPSYSSSVQVLKDTIKPEVLGEAWPVDQILSEDDEWAIFFTEEINWQDNLADSITVTNLHPSQSGTPIQYSVEVSNDRIFFSISDEEMERINNDSVKVVVKGVHDKVGNKLRTDSVVFRFIVDAFKQTPSPVDILWPENWVIAKTNKSKAVQIIINNYDLHGVSFGLDKISLEYKLVTDTSWTSVLYDGEYTRAELQANYRANQGPQDLPQDTLEMYFIQQDATEFADGEYEVRAVVHSGNNRSYSRSIPILKDVKEPKLSAFEPADGLYELGDEIIFTYDEIIDCPTLQSSLLQRLLPNGNWQTISNQVALTSSCFEDGTIKFKVESDSMSKYLGQTLRARIHGIRDMVGNGTGADERTIQFKVANTRIPTSDVRVRDLQGGNWHLSMAQDSIKLYLDSYDFNKGLDSIIVEYRHELNSSWTRYMAVDRATLKAAYNPATDGYITSYPFWFKVDSATHRDGNYLVRGVVWGNGIKNYSEVTEGRVDYTPLRVAEIISQTSKKAVYKNQIIVIKFTEPIDPTTIINQTSVMVTQNVSGSGSSTRSQANANVDVQEEHYLVSIDGNELQIDFTDAFFSAFENAEVDITISGITDESGNPLVADVTYPNVEVVNQNANSSDPGPSLSIGTNFRGVYTPSGTVQLFWSNPSDENYVGYEVERSKSAQKFMGIRFIKSQNVDGYMVEDMVNFDDRIFYRLKQLDVDSNHLYTKVIMVEKGKVFVRLSTVVFPNPSDGRTINMSIITDDLSDGVEIELYDLGGNKIMGQNISIDELSTNSHFEIELKNKLMAGIYSLVVRQGANIEYHKIRTENNH